MSQQDPPTDTSTSPQRLKAEKEQKNMSAKGDTKIKNTLFQELDRQISTVGAKQMDHSNDTDEDDRTNTRWRHNYLQSISAGKCAINISHWIGHVRRSSVKRVTENLYHSIKLPVWTPASLSKLSESSLARWVALLAHSLPPIGVAALALHHQPPWILTNSANPGWTKPAGLIEPCSVMAICIKDKIMPLVLKCVYVMCDRWLKSRQGPVSVLHQIEGHDSIKPPVSFTKLSDHQV